MSNTKPLVAAAFFCEKILEEAGGVISAVRIVDTYFVQDTLPEGLTLPPTTLPAIEVTGLISLKSGDLRGDYKISLNLRNPLGETKVLSPPEGWPIVLNGGEHGTGIKLQFPLGVKNFGLCWFDVIWEGEVLTSMPLMLKRAPKPEPVETHTR